MTYTVTKINAIDVDIFNEIYNGDKERITTAVGYDDIDKMRSLFTQDDDGVYLFQAVDSSGQVMAYIMGDPLMYRKTMRIILMVTRSADTIPNFSEPSATLMKSLGFEEVHFSVKKSSTSYNYCKNNLNRSDIYQYIGETTEEEEYTDIKLLLV